MKHAPADATAPVVRLRGVRKTYRLGTHVIPALQGVDLEVQRGELLALTGPSGSGKSTILRMIAGLTEIDASGLPTETKMKQRAAWERMAQVSYLNRMLEQDPEGVLKSLGADPRYLSPTTQFESLKKALVVQESGGDPSAVSTRGPSA